METHHIPQSTHFHDGRILTDCIDLCRNLNSNKLCFNYESKTLKLSSRIDFFLVSQPLTNRVSHLEILVSIVPDPKAIRVQ